MKRTDWYNKEKLKLDDTGFEFDIYAKNYINSLLIRAMNECGTI